jgi:hypothetical protein
VFATEPLLSTLALSIPGSGSSSRKSQVELDEVEVRVQYFTLSKLDFIHHTAADTKRDIATRKRPLISPHICAACALEFEPFLRPDQLGGTYIAPLEDRLVTSFYRVIGNYLGSA